MDDGRASAWEDAYRKRQNFLFYPDEEVVRFVARQFRRRVGLDAWEDLRSFSEPVTALDLGCGVGRHYMFLRECGFSTYGIDLSEEALVHARAWALAEGVRKPEESLIRGSVEQLPWPDGSFDCVVSHAVLDSMPFTLARQAILEVARVLRQDGLLYVDLISGDGGTHAREFCGEEEVQGSHERGTIQSYFNFTKIGRLFEGSSLHLRSCRLIRREDVLQGSRDARYHCVAGKDIHD